MRLQTYAAAMWQIMFTRCCARASSPTTAAGDSASDSVIEERSKDSASSSVIAKRTMDASSSDSACARASSLMTAAERVYTSVAQQEEPAKAWRNRKSLYKRDKAGSACKSVAQQEEPVQAWRSTRACTSVAQHKSLHKHGVQKSS